MWENNLKEKKKILCFAAPAAIVVLASLAILPFMFRPLWFDEALTINEYIRLDKISDIYFFYTIPNNHIVYNIFLKCFLGIFPFSEPMLRLPSAIFGLASVLALFYLLRRQFGVAISSLLMLCLVFSMPFSIYATAARGYMLSFLLISAALVFSLRFVKTRRLSDFAFYFFCVLLSVGTIPSNLAAIFCIFPVILLENNRVPIKKLSLPIGLLLGGVCLALAVFYLPILGKFLKAMRLKEGWPDPFQAAFHFYGALAISFLPAILFGLAGLFSGVAKRKKMFILSLAALLVPGIFFFLRSPSPFPRALFSCWPVIIYILGHLCHRTAAIMRLKLKAPHRRLIFLSVFLLIMLTAFFEQGQRAELSKFFTRSGQDDYFKPYFIENFNPVKAVRKTIELRKNRPDSIFVDKSFDYPSFIFYAGVLGIPRECIIFDFPYKQIDNLDSHREIYVVTTGDERMRGFIERFGFSGYSLEEDLGDIKIYHASK